MESSNAIVEKGIVEVSYDEGKVCTEQLKDVIEEAGYTLAPRWTAPPSLC